MQLPWSLEQALVGTLHLFYEFQSDYLAGRLPKRLHKLSISECMILLPEYIRSSR